MKDNVLNNIGDALVISVESKISGKVSLSGYSDNFIGLTDERTVSKEYRASATGIFWSNWEPLTNENIVKRNYIVESILYIQVRYTRIGTDNTGTIEFVNIEFSGSREEIQFVAPTITSSIFSNIIKTPEMRLLEENLFKKLYYRGILPQYVTRAENFDEEEDKDFITLFSTIARFFSMLICFFKRFERFYTDYDLMREQVRQYGIYFDESSITLEDLQYLTSHLYDEIRKRGTEMIFKRKGGKIAIDGEFIRLLRNKISDELLYENIPLSKTGWCLGQSSPMYRGTAQSYFLNKTKENTQDFQNLENFVFTKKGEETYALSDLDGKKAVLLKSNGEGNVGFGRIDDSVPFKEELLTVADSSLDYEITFMFRIPTAGNTNNYLQFGVEGFDILKNKLNDAFITPNGNTVSEDFFKVSLDKFRPEIWYQVRGIIHAYSSINLPNTPTNLGFGNNLYFNNLFCKYILPRIQLVSDSAELSELAVWDYKIRPLVRGTNILPLKSGAENSHSLGFIQSSKIFYVYARNNNNNQSKEEITNIIDKYLLPFNVTDILMIMSNY